MIYKTSDFDYPLNESLIAQYPLKQRDQSRLLINNKDGTIIHDNIYNLDKFLPENSLLILNNSKVIPSRLLGTTGNSSKIEILLLSLIETSQSNSIWQAIGKPMKKLKPLSKVYFAEGLEAKVLTPMELEGTVSPFTIEFNKSYSNLSSWLDKNGYIPLPPYIKRKDPKPAIMSEDSQTYQTIYADPKGSSAAPTAGLHFTKALFNKLKHKNISISYVTLHVGAGTFLPVTSENIDDHHMHFETFQIPRQTITSILDALEKNRKIIFVGTTTLRCLESYYKDYDGNENSLINNTNKWHKTNLFLHPTPTNPIYTPWAMDGLITNFHQPRSTLFILIATLFGLDKMKKTYSIAQEKKYRLFSYGDACLLWKS